MLSRFSLALISSCVHRYLVYTHILAVSKGSMFVIFGIRLFDWCMSRRSYMHVCR